MAVLSVVPVAIAPLEPQDSLVPELFCVLATDVMPAPAEADAVTVEVVAAGAAVLNPDGKVQVARERPHTALGPGGAVLTVSVSLALFPVSSVSMNRFVDVLLYVPTTGTVTLTETVHVLEAATDPPVKRIPRSLAASVPPALSVNVPPQLLDVVRGEAMTIAPGAVGNISVKLRPLSDMDVGLVMVNVSVEIPLTVVGSGLKFFAIVTTDGSRI